VIRDTTLSQLAVRTLCLFLIGAFSLVLFWPSFVGLAGLSFHDERYSQIALIPFISAGLVYLDRKNNFRRVQYCPRVGLPLGLGGAILYYVVNAQASIPSQDDKLSLLVFAIVLVWIAAFVLCYGLQTASAAIFPLTFLLLMIPLPHLLLDAAVIALQKGSAEMTELLFRFIGLPAFRQGFTFSLPGVDIEIAKECSGIRSSIALFLTSLLMGHMFLRSGWRKIGLILFTIPLVIFKNAVRIVTLAWLALHVNRDFLYGDLHHRGGLAFSIPDFAILVAFLFMLRRSEIRSAGEQVKPKSATTVKDAVGMA
jgi:exosortase